MIRITRAESAFASTGRPEVLRDQTRSLLRGQKAASGFQKS
jgi:hypothetical protein